MSYIITCIFYCFKLTGGAFDGVEDVVSPFGYRKGEGIDAGCGEVDWICNRDRERTDPIFESLKPIDGKISGAGKCDDDNCLFVSTLKLN